MRGTRPPAGGVNMANTAVQEHVASDILAAILGRLSVDKFTGDQERIHTTLARIKRHYPILGAFNFTVGDVYPFSREVEDALSILQRSKMISMENPEYSTFVITPSGRKVAASVLEEFDQDERRQLTELAEIFGGECGKPKLASDSEEPEDL
jgi:hypothetical protein